MQGGGLPGPRRGGHCSAPDQGTRTGMLPAASSPSCLHSAHPNPGGSKGQSPRERRGACRAFSPSSQESGSPPAPGPRTVAQREGTCPWTEHTRGQTAAPGRGASQRRLGTLGRRDHRGWARTDEKGREHLSRDETSQQPGHPGAGQERGRGREHMSSQPGPCGTPRCLPKSTLHAGCKLSRGAERTSFTPAQSRCNPSRPLGKQGRGPQWESGATASLGGSVNVVPATMGTLRPPTPFMKLQATVDRFPRGSRVQKGSPRLRAGPRRGGAPRVPGLAWEIRACAPALFSGGRWPPKPTETPRALPPSGPPWIQGRALAVTPGVPKRDKCLEGNLAPSLPSSVRCLSVALAVATQGVSGFPSQALPPTTSLSAGTPTTPKVTQGRAPDSSLQIWLVAEKV